jgi:hypothetical protein
VLLVPELKEEAALDAGLSFKASISFSPKPPDLLFSILACLSSFSRSLFLLSAIRSLKDLIFGESAPRAELDLRSPPPAPLLA